jgi:hypothetical protein
LHKSQPHARHVKLHGLVAGVGLAAQLAVEIQQQVSQRKSKEVNVLIYDTVCTGTATLYALAARGGAHLPCIPSLRVGGKDEMCLLVRIQAQVVRIQAQVVWIQAQVVRIQAQVVWIQALVVWIQAQKVARQKSSEVIQAICTYESIYPRMHMYRSYLVQLTHLEESQGQLRRGPHQHN